MRWPISSTTLMLDALDRCQACRARLADAAICPRCGCDFSLVRQAELAAARRLAQAARLLAGGDRAAASIQLDVALELKGSGLARAIKAFLADGRPPADGQLHQESARCTVPSGGAALRRFSTDPCGE
jgi:hypothetical protein